AQNRAGCCRGLGDVIIAARRVEPSTDWTIRQTLSRRVSLRSPRRVLEHSVQSVGPEQEAGVIREYRSQSRRGGHNYTRS
ncbi:hypothetical protein RZS08_41060, partial [Arthrospira platensis SPKY1]|nr:hypothetical protein [Arthrospira platensis SPKY1]